MKHITQNDDERKIGTEGTPASFNRDVINKLFAFLEDSIKNDPIEKILNLKGFSVKKGDILIVSKELADKHTFLYTHKNVQVNEYITDDILYCISNPLKLWAGGINAKQRS